MRRKRLLPAAAVVLAGLLLAGGAWRVWHRHPPLDLGDLANYADPARDALLVPGPAGEAAERIAYLDQGWEPRDSVEFYTRPQGSRLIPYRWFLALEQVGADIPFADPAHLARFGFLAQRANPFNPDGLPVGFLKDPRRDGEKADWFGFTCAACHTAELHHAGTAYRIDGAAGQGDLDGLLVAMTAALGKPLADPAAFDRFADRLGATDPARLRAELEAVSHARREYDAANRPPHPYGFARLDAFGRISNALLGGAVGVPGQTTPPDAPVNYPFLWDTPHHDYVQWNGVARNKTGRSDELGGLARNIGEVLGVFGEVRVSDPGTATVFTGYASSVRVPDLIRLEQLVRQLRSPQWPADFPPLDEAKRAAGGELFARHCQTCHRPINRDDPDRTVSAAKVPVAVVGTDPRMAANFAARAGKTGRLQGRRAYFVSGERFGREAAADAVLVHTVVGVMLASPWTKYEAVELADLRDSKATAPDPARLMVYKARPLNGVWATAPFLHNGSVPTLYDLLLPPDQRPSEFTVGRREFDPVRVGFRTDPFPGGFRFRTTDDAGRPVPGNGNAGHEYGTRLTDAERWQLVEYLKSL